MNTAFGSKIMANIDVSVALESLKNTSNQNAETLKEQGQALKELVSIGIKQAEMSQQMISLSERQSDYQERTDKKIDSLSTDVKVNTRTNNMWIGAGAALSVISVLIAIYANLGKIIGS